MTMTHHMNLLARLWSRASSWAIISVTLLLVCAPSVDAACVNDINVCDGDYGGAYRPLPTCQSYAYCENGRVADIITCADGSIYDVLLQRCNWEYVSFCIVQSCPPTPEPTSSPSESPSASPSASPSESPSESPTDSPSASPSQPPTQFPTPLYDFFGPLETESMKLDLEGTVFQSYNPAGIASPSTKYHYDGLISALREMALQGITSDGRLFKFYIGTPEGNLAYGRTNLALFLANAMTESIEYDTCDEFNNEAVADRYALSNACGQNYRSYQDEVCTGPGEKDMSCPVDPWMRVVSSGYSTSMMGRAPPPFSCKPKAHSADYAGYWDGRTGASSNSAYSNGLGRTDLEGCCWWGRGALLTRGVCNIGKLDYYLGKRAYVERGEGKFWDIDFCAFPEATCANEQGMEGTEEIRWITGLFEWIERVQSYPNWSYIYNLQRYVDGGMKDDSFIDAVSSIFTRDCHLPECSSRLVTMKERRKENFLKVLDVFGLPALTLSPTELPTQKPTTPRPTTPSPVKNILPPALYQPSPPVPPPHHQSQHNNPTIPVVMPAPNEGVVVRPSQAAPETPPQPMPMQWQPSPPTQQSEQVGQSPPANPGEMPTQPSEPSEPSIPTPATEISPRTKRPTNKDEELIRLDGNSASLFATPWLALPLTTIMFALHS